MGNVYYAIDTTPCSAPYNSPHNLWGDNSLLEVIITDKTYYRLYLFSVYERSASPK